MALSEDEKLKNDMTKTGKFCPNGDGYQLEKVSNEPRLTCHWCGGVFEIDEKEEVKKGWFDGFKK